MAWKRLWVLAAGGVVAATLMALPNCSKAPQTAALKLYNVSYDPTRDLYQDVIAAFSKEY